MPLLLRCCLLVFLLWQTGGRASADDVLPVPAAAAAITDDTGVLSYSQKRQLDQKIAHFNAAGGSQLAVLIVRTTQPEDIFSYGFRVADTWRLGHKGRDDSVLLVVATDDHADNIQVGYGLEGRLTDSRCKQILQDTMAPFFHDGDFNGGINAGVDAILPIIGGELPAPSHTLSPFAAYFVGFLSGLLAAVVLAILLGRRIGGTAGGLLALAVTAALGASWLHALELAMAVALLVWVRIRLTDSGRRYDSGTDYSPDYGPGDIYSSTDSSSTDSSSSDSSSSDSDVSTDGGTFGGGGSSGDW